ncbi:hypothetical protein WDW37_10150 [Bdellovibrionota bacterium FG-1]
MKRYDEILKAFEAHVSAEVERLVADDEVGKSGRTRSEKVKACQEHWASFRSTSIMQQFSITQRKVEAALLDRCGSDHRDLKAELDKIFDEASLKPKLDRLSGTQEALQTAGDKAKGLVDKHDSRNFFIEGCIAMIFDPKYYWSGQGNVDICKSHKEIDSALHDAHTLEERFKRELHDLNKCVSDSINYQIESIELIESKHQRRQSA